MFEDLDFVAVGVGDERHLFAVHKFFTPVGGPELEPKSICFQAFEHFAISAYIVNPDAGMDKVFREFYLKLGGEGKLELVGAPGNS
jgi:hypothetical protein